MARRRNQRGWIVLESIASDDGHYCVDFFEFPRGGFGFEHFRCDPEDGRWTLLGGYGASVSASTAITAAKAVEHVGWLASNPGASDDLARWLVQPDGDRVSVVHALQTEIHALAGSVSSMSAKHLVLPTRCAPWDVTTLLGHMINGLNRCVAMVQAPSNKSVDANPLVYYESSARSDPERDLKRHRAAAAAASELEASADTALAFTTVADQIVAARGELGSAAVVETHWGPVLGLDNYLTTRVVEIAVHGLDLADALGRSSWLTPLASRVVVSLLAALGPGRPPGYTSPDDDGELFIRANTGRSMTTTARHVSLLG